MYRREGPTRPPGGAPRPAAVLFAVVVMALVAGGVHRPSPHGLPDLGSYQRRYCRRGLQADPATAAEQAQQAHP